MSKLATEHEFAELLDGGLGRKLKAYSTRQSGRTFDHNDLEAEGLVAMWHEFQRLPKNVDSQEAYLLQVAKNRILTVIRLENWTGAERHTRFTTKARDEIAVSPDVLYDVEEFEDPDLSLVEISDIRAAVRRELATLTPLQRDRLFRKYWLGESVPLLSWWYHPTKGLRQKLQRTLAHLETKGA